MSHTINLYVLKATSNVANLSHLPHVVENGYILMPLSDQVIAELGIDYMDDDYQRKAEHKLLQSCPDMAWVETDYFGGAGEQDAKAWVNRVPFLAKNGDTSSKHMSINEALAALGVERTEDSDEFDVINLGRYRSNHDVINEWEEITGKTTEKVMRRLLLKNIPKLMQLFLHEERLYTSFSEYVCAVVLAKDLNHPSKRYYRCVTNNSVNMYNDDTPNTLNFKETRTRITEAEFSREYDKAISHCWIEYWKDTIYTFIKYAGYPVDMGVKDVTTLCAVEYECDNLGVAVLHDQVKSQALMYDDNFTLGPYTLGRNNRPETFAEAKAKPKLVKKTVEVYECPDCKKGTLTENAGLYCCNVCNYKVDIADTDDVKIKGDNI